MRSYSISSYFAMTTTLLVVGAILTISGALYFSFSRSLTREFEDRVRAEGRELGLCIKNRLSRVDNRIRELANDNTVRVTLMLGAEQQLQEHLQRKYSADQATNFFITAKDSNKILDAGTVATDPRAVESLLASAPQGGRLERDAYNRFRYAKSQFVYRKQEVIGSAACVYYFNGDTGLVRLSDIGKDKKLLVVEASGAWDLFSNRSYPLTVNSFAGLQDAGLSYSEVNGNGVAVARSDEYPSIVYVSSLASLQQAKKRVLLLVVVSAVSVLVFSISISLYLSRKLGLPLAQLSGNALEIAEGETGTTIGAISSNITEVNQLTFSLSRMIANLRQANELKRYQELFEGVADTVFIHDLEGNILESNPVASVQFGYSKDEFRHTNLKTIIPPRQHDRFDRMVKGLRHLEDKTVFEIELTSKSGRTLFTECHARRTVFRKMDGVLNVVRDITDRCKAEEAVRVSEERYRSIVETSHVGIIIVDGSFKFEYVNDEFSRIADCPAHELIGTDFRRVLDEESKIVVSTRYKARQNGTEVPSRYEFNILRANGDKRRVEISATVIRDSSGETKTIAQLLDITDKKNFEQALLASEERYRTILESSAVGYFEIDLAGNFLFINDAICGFLEAPVEEIKGTNFREYVDKETAATLKKIYNQVFTSGKPRRSVEYAIYLKNGATKTIDNSVLLIRNAAGEAIGFRGLGRDITDQRNLETQLQRAQKMEAIGTLAGGVAHDLNNILSGIMSYPELLLMDMDDSNPLRQPILTIKQSGEKAAAIVQDLLTLARRGVAVKEVVNLNAIVSDYLQSPEFDKLMIFHQGVRIETHLDPTLSNISGSPVHLAKTVMNVISNAAEAMPDGGTIRIVSENRYVGRLIGSYDKVRAGEYAALEIQDEGTGIAQKDLNKIFEPFFTKKVMGRSGTGLGMAVVWGTVKDHNGYIDVKSTEHVGTTFTLYFPITRNVVAQCSSTFSIDDFRGNGESILIVDDVAEQRLIASSMLNKLGYSVAQRASGEEAVEFAKNEFPDLIILDMIMDPGIDGLETYKRIIELNPDQKAIIASGFSETQRVIEAQDLGAGEYIKKPYTIEKLGMTVKKALSGAICEDASAHAALTA